MARLIGQGRFAAPPLPLEQSEPAPSLSRAIWQETPARALFVGLAVGFFLGIFVCVVLLAIVGDAR